MKENNALANRKKEHYACEIKRLNKVPDQEGPSERPSSSSSELQQNQGFSEGPLASAEDELSSLHRAPSHSMEPH